MAKKKYKFKTQRQETLFNSLLASEDNCSFNGRQVLITGNTSKLDDRDLALSYPITPDQFNWLKLKVGARNLSLDHSNSYKQLRDKKGKSWFPRPACIVVDENGNKHHPFLSSVLKDYPGEDNWTY